MITKKELEEEVLKWRHVSIELALEISRMLVRLRDNQEEKSVGRYTLKNPWYRTDDLKSYGYIPLGESYKGHLTELFEDLFLAVKTLNKNRSYVKDGPLYFLDVGCGPANIMRMVKSIFSGIVVHGLEIDKKTIEIAHNTGDYNIFNCDINKWNGYKDYNIIYSYMPLKNVEDMEKVSQRIVKQMKKGAIFIPRFLGNGRSNPYPSLKKLKSLKKKDRNKRHQSEIYQKV